jgi:Na+-dependent transporters of the SNF family
MDKRQNLVKSSFITAIGDTMASLIAGFVILPLVFVFNIDPRSGPPLMFITLPEIFRLLPGGILISTLFFMALLFAAILSAVPGFEIFIDAVERYGLSRRKAAILMGLIEIVLGIPSMLSIDILMYNDLFWGSTMLPMASLFSIIAFGWFIDEETLRREIGLRKENLAWKLFYYWVRIAMPVIVILILIQGWISWLS